MWESASQSVQYRSLVAPFSDLRGMGSICGLHQALAAAHSTAFDGMQPADRQHVLFLLHTCDANDGRRLAMGVRNLYLRQVYGALQEALTGVRLNLYASDAFIQSHIPTLPPTRLRYDCQTREITHQDGEIDYLIVGSGPAGAVLAHELRRGGGR